jgi:probable F420-dependent oxidoreductase
MRVGVMVPSHGSKPLELGYGTVAAAAEEAGFASVWCGDHVLMPESVTSRYPGSTTGTPHWPVAEPFFDCVVAMSMMGATTTSIEVGVGILILGLRDPIVVAKQMATLDVLTGNRVVLGLGAGWLEEEFVAMGKSFSTRGRDLDAGIETLRRCWSGRVDDWQPPRGGDVMSVYFSPTPTRAMPLLLGGAGPAVARRIARLGDGWIAMASTRNLMDVSIEGFLDLLRRETQANDRDLTDLRLILRLTQEQRDLDELVRLAPKAAGMGFSDLLVAPDWDRPDDLNVWHDALSAAVVTV